MPLLRRGRMLKRWRYVGVFGPDVMLCVGAARIGPAPLAWWAVWDREGKQLHERTRLGWGRQRVAAESGRVHVDDGDAYLDLRVDEGPAIEVVTEDGHGFAWTAKHGRAHARGNVRAGARRWAIDGPAFVDVSAGYHPRRTAWRWSAGCGELVDGRPVAWNLVEGIHDSATASERTLWVDGEPSEPAPVSFAGDLSGVAFADGARLRFHAEATRRRDDNLLLIRSRYDQPFGAFLGTLPGGLELAEAYGVMERHEALW